MSPLHRDGKFAHLRVADSSFRADIKIREKEREVIDDVAILVEYAPNKNKIFRLQCSLFSH